MKPTDFKKMYGNLSPEELAKITFNSLISGDTKLANQICDSVPRHNYNRVDVDYSKTLDKIFEACSLLAIEYWKTNSQYMSFLFLKSDSKTDDVDTVKLDIEHGINARRKLMAIGCVLKSFCESQCLDIEAVLKFVGNTNFAGVDIESCELEDSFIEYYSSMLALCESLLTGETLSKQHDEYFSIH